ncbi:hypothetical protein NIES2100_17620 [Calothrix sp. NIES-2100]|nr:hypothetical protein NIES2100_17620 [Calothrix sp. NIES-2100]
MNKDESEIFNLLKKAGSLRAVEIHKTLFMGFHRLYQSLHRLKEQGLIQGRMESRRLLYEITGLQPQND